ncbi:MAG: GNAT family N-acetyltransferase [Candidatus Nanopelagicales bacterium]
MRDLPPGFATDLAVLEHTGSTVEDLGDHLIVRSPSNPDFHWGNCLFVLDDAAVDDATRWVSTFEAAFPQATWIAIGLVRMPIEVDVWSGLGLTLELEDVLTTRVQPKQSLAPPGYVVRPLVNDDVWEQSVRRSLAENEATGEYDPVTHERFARALVSSRKSLTDKGIARFFGAFEDGQLVADLGIVRCGATARYQAVVTDPAHRGRGLASHLLGVAAQWSAERGCDRWVIITEATNPAGRVYRKAGFEPDTPSTQAYRPPPR